MNPWERSVKKFNKKVRNGYEFLSLSPRMYAKRANRGLDRIPRAFKPRTLFGGGDGGVGGSVHTASLPEPQTIDEDENENGGSRGGSVGLLRWLPLQARRKFLQQSFPFTLMVVGRSGLGKSTLVNSLFHTDIYNDGQYPGPTLRTDGQTVSVESTTVMLVGRRASLRLTVVDTPGFGDQLDNTYDGWKSIEQYIDRGNHRHFRSEMLSSRNASGCGRLLRSKDERVHCCLYFIAPTGHRLSVLDLEFMRRLHRRVSLIPIIGKADTLTPNEMIRFKANIREDLTANGIDVYEFPGTGIEPERLPLAVIGSNYVLQQDDGRRFLGRQYPWGTVNIQNPEHCDFETLRDLLIGHSLYDLVDHTDRHFYQEFRNRQLEIILSKKSKFHNLNTTSSSD